MKIEIAWQVPILLAANKKLSVDEYTIPERVTNRPGVYFLSRRYGSKSDPFYIGETTNLRGRLRDHLKDYRVRDVLRGNQDKGVASGIPKIAKGNKYFHFGFFIGKRGQDAKKCIEIVQAHMIELALADEIPLLNTQLTKIPTHSIAFTGPRAARGSFGRSFQVRIK